MFRLLSIVLFFVTLSLADTPKPYSNLGDEIYNTTERYEKLASQLPKLEPNVTSYLVKTRKVKALGYEAQMDHSVTQTYLKALRELDHDRQILLTGINAALYDAMDHNDNSAFRHIINARLLKMDKVGDDVIPYYKKRFHKGDIAILDQMLSEEKRYKNDAKKAQVNYAKQVEDRRIERMRSARENLSEQKEQALEAELEAEKERVQQNLEAEMIR